MKTTKRYYVPWSSWFNINSNPYDIDKIKAAVKKGGGKNIRTCNCYGWSNQPKVVTFTAETSEIKENIMGCLKESHNTWAVYVYFKNW
jgi:hypothetical protein